MSKPDVDEARQERMRRAVKAFRRMQPMLTAYAKAITGNPKVRVVLSKHSAMTDGVNIYYRPPLALGDQMEHDRRVCDQRDPDTRIQLCRACSIREEVMVNIYHEVGHIAFDSFAKTSEAERKHALTVAIDEMGQGYADKILKSGLFNQAADTYLGLAAMINPYLQGLLNAIEDARVDSTMMDARPGIRVMMQASSNLIFSGGLDADEWTDVEASRFSWENAPLNAQAGLACMVRAVGYTGWEGYLNPAVVEHTGQPGVLKLLEKLKEVSSVSGTFAVVVPLMEELRKYGYFQKPEELPEFDPPDIPPDEGGDDSGDEQKDDDSSGGEGEGDSSESKDQDDSSGQQEDTPGSDEVDDEASGSGGGDQQEEAEESSGDADQDSTGDDSGSDDLAPDQGDDEGSGVGSEPGDESAGQDEDSSDEGSSGGDGEEAGDPGDSGESDDHSEDPGDGSDSDAGAGEESGDDGGSSSQGDEASEEQDGGDGGSSAGDSSDDGSVPDGEEVPGEVPAEDVSDSAEPDGNKEVPVRSGPEQDAGEESATPPTPHKHGTDGDPCSCKYCVVYGTPEDLEELIEAAHAHATEDGESIKQGPSKQDEDEEEFTIFIVQAEYFDVPSTEVHGVNVIRDGSTHFRVHPNLETVPEGVLAPALLRVRRVFADNMKGGESRNLKTGRVDVGVLGRRAWSGGDNRLFKKNHEPETKDYSVLIGLDASSSSIGREADIIRMAGLAQADLCHRAGIRFAVYGHSGNYSADSRKLEDYDQWQYEMSIIEIKKFNEPWSAEARERMMKFKPSGGNVDGHTLEYYRKRLDEERTTDRILMYYTDGEMPASNYQEELEILQREIKICKRNDYVLMGVGIGTDSPRDHGLDTVQIDSADQINLVIKHLEKRLVGRS